ncbi:MAG: hypothetical protein RL660_2034 [Bacteroidota bacterium]|jgi:hypothetical protein
MDKFLSILLHLHSGFRWILLVLIVLVLVNSFVGMRSKGLFTKTDDKLSKYTVLLSHVMLIVGLLQYFLGTKGYALIKANGMANVMKDGFQRFYAVEHISTMIIAIILLTVGRSVGKRKSTSSAMHKTIFWFTLVALLLMVFAIPWPFATPWAAPGVRGGWG